jgi:hypothetical protein
MSKRKLVIDGVDYLRADTVHQIEKPATKERQYTVLSFGQDVVGETIFMRLKGFKSVKFKPGSVIRIQILNQPTNQPTNQPRRTLR